MRGFLLAFAAIATLSVGATIASTPAGAVVCACGVLPAGCAWAHGAAVVRPLAACRGVIVNGERIRRWV
jgi:hypothetical protein